MLRSLYTAASGMKANQLYIDNISNNLSNVNNHGFKKSRIEFEDLIYQTIKEPGGTNADGNTRPTGIQVGLGTNSVSIQKNFMQGNLESTGVNTDIAINGDGFLQIQMPNGSISYTRAGSLKVNSEGQLVTAQGYLLEPNISIPDDAKGDVNFSPDGTVTAIMQAGEMPEQIGQLELARFINPGGLKSLGGNLYAESDASGPAMVGAPGEDNMGTLRSQFLEMSNVQMVEEMVNMIVAQRAYEVASKAITTSDDMLQTANQLKR